MSTHKEVVAAQARHAILDAADQLFYPRGIAAVTMTEIRDEASVSLRRLYGLFPSKSDLVLEWLRDRHENWLTWIRAELDQRLTGGADIVDAVFDAVGQWLVTTEFRGCGFLNTLSEGAELTQAHRDAIRRHKQEFIGVLAEHHDSPHALAVMVDGAIVQSAVFASLDQLEAARAAAHLLPPPATDRVSADLSGTTKEAHR